MAEGERDRPKYLPLRGEELLIGLVYGAGTETALSLRLLKDALHPYGYERRVIHLSNYFPAMLGDPDFRAATSTATRQLQEFGDLLRERCEEKAILAQLAIYLIAAKRQRDNPSSRTAWVVRSLRRPEEVEQLRRVYGPRFILVAVHTPEAIRQRNAEERWRRWAPTTGRYETEATRDIRRDELDPERDYGQRTRETFSLADFFVNASSEQILRRDIDRCVKLIFGWPFVPPTREEQAMYHAYTGALRSSEMGRQVGAAITTSDGDLVAVGTNDVPSGKGGLYWSPDHPDERDFAKQVPSDSNTLWKRRTARELLLRMADQQWIEPALYIRHSREQEARDELDVTEEQLDAFLAGVKGTRFADISEFGRAVHAEMDAITTAARLGHRISGSTLVCTTFPCHNCTRHIVAAGIRRVIYIYPYAKSLALDLHSDSIELDPEDAAAVRGKVIFEQFIGVAPRGYPQYFGFGQTPRSNNRGNPVREPDPATAQPRVLQESGTFSFGGPAVPATRIAQVERQIVRSFRQHVARTPEVQIPSPAKTEDEA